MLSMTKPRRQAIAAAVLTLAAADSALAKGKPPKDPPPEPPPILYEATLLGPGFLLDMNNQGTVVGARGDRITLVGAATVYTTNPPSWTDLNTIPDVALSGYHTMHAFGINEQGQIVGNARHHNSVSSVTASDSRRHSEDQRETSLVDRYWFVDSDRDSGLAGHIAVHSDCLWASATKVDLGSTFASVTNNSSTRIQKAIPNGHNH